MDAIKPIKGSIIVACNILQKDEINIGSNVIKTGKRYNENFRERNPVVAYVVSGNDEIPFGSYIICNYSHFDLESPYEFESGLYSIPVDSEIYAIINPDGSLEPVCGNVLVWRVGKEYSMDMPEELRKTKMNTGAVASHSKEWQRGQMIYWLPYADYEIVYQWNGEEKRAIKIHRSEITGYLKNA